MLFNSQTLPGEDPYHNQNREQSDMYNSQPMYNGANHYQSRPSYQPQQAPSIAKDLFGQNPNRGRSENRPGQGSNYPGKQGKIFCVFYRKLPHVTKSFSDIFY